MNCSFYWISKYPLCPHASFHDIWVVRRLSLGNRQYLVNGGLDLSRRDLGEHVAHERRENFRLDFGGSRTERTSDNANVANVDVFEVYLGFLRK